MHVTNSQFGQKQIPLNRRTTDVKNQKTRQDEAKNKLILSVPRWQMREPGARIGVSHSALTFFDVERSLFLQFYINFQVLRHKPS